MTSSRHYFVSNENMSDIKESIEEYSMRFDNESGPISEMISGSHQVSQSRAPAKTKKILEKAPMIEEQNDPAPIDNNKQKPVYLGDHVYKNIRQRFYETNKITTDDPNVLYDYFLSQRKQLSSMKPITQEEIMKQMPSMQRKLLVKHQFQKILTYYPMDVYYSLCYEAEKIKEDRRVAEKVELLNRETKNNEKRVSKKDIDSIVEKLYKTKSGLPEAKKPALSPEQEQKMKRTKFGRNLSEHFQNTYRDKGSPSNVETVDKLFSFWEDLYEREEYGIEWEQETAKQTIERCMYEQIEDLIAYASKKLGFKCGKAASLYKFYTKNFESIENIYIPLNSFEEYVKVYNEVERRKQEEDKKHAKQNENKDEQKKKKSEIKKFGRPVSATPITILAKPKTQKNAIEELSTKFPSDKLVKTLRAEQNLRKPRYAFQYGVYDIEDEVKLKQWIKIDPKKPAQKYDELISQQLFKTFTGPSFYKVHEKDQLMSIFAQENIHQDEDWKHLGPVLHEAMLVKAYEHKWFVDCILRYLERSTGQNLKQQTNTVIFNKLFTFLNDLTENERNSQLQKLETLITTSESLAENTEKMKNLGKDVYNDTKQRKQRKILNQKLEVKAIEYVKMRITKNDDKFVLRNYLKELFQEFYKDHREYVQKNFHVVEGDKECPKLLKYEFFRLVKEVNPITLEKQATIKSHAWIPTKQSPESFNYKTYNHFAEAYTKDKSSIAAAREKQQLRDGLWGRKKGKERELLMMTFNDAKECTFQPKISKKGI